MLRIRAYWTRPQLNAALGITSMSEATSRRRVHTISAELQCDAILFDLDGVLVESQTVVERAWHRWSALRGLHVPRSGSACPRAAKHRDHTTRVYGVFGPVSTIIARVALPPKTRLSVSATAPSTSCAATTTTWNICSDIDSNIDGTPTGLSAAETGVAAGAANSYRSARCCCATALF